jgi:DNA-binding NarL/FixJ family response regulator
VSDLRVLIADDDDGFRRMLAELLSAHGGVDVVGTARDGREAVERFRALAPDVVLMDVVMPVCDGIEATRQIVALDPLARVVALTGGDDHRSLALCLAAGAKGALKKVPDSIALAPLMLALAGAREASTSRRSESRRKSSMSANRRRSAANLTVQLKPGRYVVLCNLAGHYSGGMRANLSVK